MVTFKMIKENIMKSGNNSMISVFNALLLPDKDEILDYYSDRVYNTGDIVYINDENEYPYHFFYEATIDGITGPFDKSKWRPKTIVTNETNKHSRCIGELHVHSLTTTSGKKIDLSQEGFTTNNNKDILVFRNDSIMKLSSYYVDATNNLIFNDPVNIGDEITIFSIDVQGPGLYHSHNEYSGYVGPSYQTEISVNENLTGKKVIVFGGKRVLKPNVEYTCSSNVVTFTVTENQQVSIHVFGNSGGLNACAFDSYTFTEQGKSFALNAVNWDYTRDDIILFSSVRGCIPKSSISIKENVISVNGNFESGETIYYITMTRDPRVSRYKLIPSDLSPSTIETFANPKTEIFDFTIGACTKVINISGLGIPDSNYSIDHIVYSDSPGDICFSYSNKTKDSFTAKYSGLAKSVKVSFSIK